MKINLAKDESEREFDWELHSWSIPNPEGAPGHFNIWHQDGGIALSNDEDLYESIQMDTAEEVDQLIERLIAARKDVFGVHEQGEG
jgi:hypothetical protein